VVACAVHAVAGASGDRAVVDAVGDGDVVLACPKGRASDRGIRQRRREHVAGAGALIDGGRGEVDGGRGDGVDHVGGGGAAADAEALEVAAGDAGDVGGEAGGVAIDVLAVARGNGERPGGGAVGDRDIALVGVDGGSTLRRIGQRRREHVAGAGALIDGRRGEVDGGRGDGVGDLRRRRAGADVEAFPTRRSSDLDVGGEAGGIAIDVLAVARGNGERPGGGAVGDRDIAL